MISFASVANRVTYDQSDPQLDAELSRLSILGKGHDSQKEHKQRVLKILRKLNRDMAGSALLSHIKEFANASSIWNQVQEPTMAVALANNEADVQIAIPVLIKLGHDHDVLFRIKSGGHKLSWLLQRQGWDRTIYGASRSHHRV